MVCVACNGKGYVIEKGKELSCPDCQGRGEYPLLDSLKLPDLDYLEVQVPKCSAALGR